MPDEPRVADLAVPPDEQKDVKGGVGGVYVAAGDVNGDNAGIAGADGSAELKKLPGKRKPPTLTL